MARDIHNKHDAFFRFVMSDIDVAKAYMENFLPEELKAIIDISRLEQSPSSYVSEDMKQTYADIVFQCPLRKPYLGRIAHVCLLAEHKFAPFKFTSIQAVGYSIDAYRQQIRNKQDPLIPVIPIIYYHGKKGWTPPTIPELFDWAGEDVLPFIPGIRILFHSLAEFSDEQLKQLGNGLLTSAMLTQKYASRPDQLIERLKDIFSIVRSWDNRNQVFTLFVYFAELVKEEEGRLNKLIENLPKDMKTEVLSWADQLRKEGVEKGMEKGIEKSKKETIQNMLRKGLSLELISDVMNVSKGYVESVRTGMK